MKMKVKQADGTFKEVDVEAIDAIKGAVQEGVKPLESKIATLEEANAKAIEENAALKEKVSKLENAPVFQAKNVYVGSSERYLGYKVDKQMRDIRHIASKSPERFDVFSNPEKTDDYVKFMIDLTKALKSKNPADHARFQKRLEEYVEKNQDDPVIKAAYAEGATTTGGYLVPTEYLWDMVQLARSRTFALDLCRVIPMGSNQMLVPTEATLPSVAWTAEAVAATESEGTFGQGTLTAKRLDAFATASNEQLADSALDMVGILTEQFGYAAALELDNQVLNGTGSPVSGVLTAACGNSVVLGTGSTNFSAQIADNYSNAIYSLSESDTANAQFIINRISKHYLRVLKDSQGRFIFANPGQGVPGAIWEYPYRVSEKITSASAVSTAFAVFGDFQKFFIGRRLGFSSLDVDPYGLFTSNSTRFRLASRWAFLMARSSAFCRILTSAS